MKLQLKLPFWTSKLSGEDQQKKADELSRARGASFIKSVNEEIWSIFTDTSTNAISQPFVFNKKQKPVGRLDFRIPIGGGPSPFGDGELSEKAKAARERAETLLEERSGNTLSGFSRAKTNMEIAAGNQWIRLENSLKHLGKELMKSELLINAYEKVAQDMVSHQKHQVRENYKEHAPLRLSKDILRDIDILIATYPIDDKMMGFRSLTTEMRRIFAEIKDIVQWESIYIQSSTRREGIDGSTETSDTDTMISFSQVSKALHTIPSKIERLRVLNEDFADTSFLTDQTFSIKTHPLEHHLKKIAGYLDTINRNL